MINFDRVSVNEFLSDYWQKKPCVLRNALPDFTLPLTPDELAGLAMEDDIESRMVFETPGSAPFWHLKRGPFSEQDFETLPPTHWTLLVQGVDRFVPEVAQWLRAFNFLPSWRVDDIMISFAPKHGSVGPHYDNYDVFLYQALGKREWSLTSKHCEPGNALQGVELRIMKEFHTEEVVVLEEGDMLYLPPHIGHHGVSLSDECMTFSFGYRSYQNQEMWQSFSDYLADTEHPVTLYKDPDWSGLKSHAEIPKSACRNARELLQNLLDDKHLFQSWFGSFATQPDHQAEQCFPSPLEDDEYTTSADFLNEWQALQEPLERIPVCRMAYLWGEHGLQLFINGCEWDIAGVSEELVQHIADNNTLIPAQIAAFLDERHPNAAKNRELLFELWKLQWIQYPEQ